jgi:rubrerythrin
MSPNPSSSQARSTTAFSRGSSSTRSTSQQTDRVTSEAFSGLGARISKEQVQELLCQALETEIGGVQIYETAVRCAQNEELKEEWNQYLDETRNHERILRECFETLDMDPEMETPGRGIVRANGEAFVQAMETALESGDENLAQIVAAECVVLAETKDHMNWELIGEVAKEFEGEGGTALQEAYDEIEEQEDEHLYHTRGWARELWLESFGLPAVLPPPEEEKNVTTEIGAARAKNERTRMTKASKGGRGRSSNKSVGGKKTRGRGAKSRGRSR